MRLGQQGQELPPEQRRQHMHVHQEVRFGRHPLGTILRQPAAGHDHVHVRMVDHRRAPGVEDGGDSDAGTEVLGIGGDLQRGLGRRLHQQAIDDGLVLVGHVAQLTGQRVHDMKVRHGQQLGFPFGQPLARGGPLALGAMSIATAVKSDERMPAGAVLTARNMAAERHRAAALDRTHHLQLAEADVTAVGDTPSVAVIAEDIRDLQIRAGHGAAATRSAARSWSEACA